MFPAAMRLLHIKDLKDLRALLCRRDYRHAGPKGPEEMSFTGAIAGDRPPRYGTKNGAFHRRARACPSPCLDRNGKCLGRRAFFARVERSRGTGPRATVKKRAVYRRARACPSPCLDRNGKWPWPVCGFRAGRAIAGDRPPRYGPGRGSPRHAPFGIRRSRTTVSCPYNLAKS